MSTTAIRSLTLHRPALLAHDDADERQRRSSHPLLATALFAFYDVGNMLHILWRSHNCNSAACQLCHDARMAWALLAPVECSFEGEFSFDSDPKLARRRAESDRFRGTAPRRPARRWRPDTSGNFPPLPLAVMAMIDLGKALEALRDGWGDEGAYVYEQAEVGAYLVPLLTAQLEASLLPCPVILRRRGVNPGREPLLRLLEQAELQ